MNTENRVFCYTILENDLLNWGKASLAFPQRFKEEEGYE